MRIFLVSLLFFPATLFAQGFLKTSGTRIVNEKGENVLLRGIGLGGWMLQEGYMLRVNREGQQHKIKERIAALIGPARTEEFYNAWLQSHTTRADVEALKRWGFNSIRLPMHFNLYTLPVDKEPVAGVNTWLDKGFALTDSLLAWCRDHQMYLILDLHAAPGGQGNDLNISDRDGSKPSLWDDPAQQQKTIALWKKIAERYKDEKWIAGYDVLNEPNQGFDDPVKDKNGIKEKTNAPLKKLLMEITKAIREVDKHHIIIIEGNGWGNNYNGMLPPWDTNMVLSFHKYWNYNDEGSIRHILRFRDQYQVPVWIGETGENSNVWFTQAIRLFEKNNIGWAWWPLKKIGTNNPLEIPMNPQYQQVLNYWSGGKDVPHPDEAFKGLIQLARDARFENNIFHKDVIDAMLRQPTDPTARPFHTGKEMTISAADYDLGPIGVAYHDTDSANYRVSDPKALGGNSGRAYRNDGVDIRFDAAGKPYIMDIAPGEWWQYTINVPKKGNYIIALEVAGEGKVAIGVNDRAVAEEIGIAGTKDWQTVRSGRLKLEKGGCRVRVLARTGGFEFKSLSIHKQ